MGRYAQYYDSPDGQDIDTKVMVTTRYGMLVGTIISTFDILMYSHAVGLSNVMSRYMFHTIPLAAIGATFAAVANGVQNFREKDDPLNYFFGGLACGPILGHYFHSKHAVVVGGLALGAIGFIKKTGVDAGWQFNPPVEPHMGMVNSWRNDWTMAQDPKISGTALACLCILLVHSSMLPHPRGHLLDAAAPAANAYDPDDPL